MPKFKAKDDTNLFKTPLGGAKIICSIPEDTVLDSDGQVTTDQGPQCNWTFIATTYKGKKGYVLTEHFEKVNAAAAPNKDAD